jgi:hypothetical protein
MRRLLLLRRATTDEGGNDESSIAHHVRVLVHDKGQLAAGCTKRELAKDSSIRKVIGEETMW